MNTASDIALVAVCATVLASGLLVVRSSRSSHWQRTLWAFAIPSGQSPKIIFEAIHGQETGLYRRPEVGQGSVAAVARLSVALYDSRRGFVGRMLRRPEPAIELSSSDERRADTWCAVADTIVVGGPKVNVITAEILRAFGCQPTGPVEVDELELLRCTASVRPSKDAVATGLGLATSGNNIFWFGEKFAGRVTLDPDPNPGASGYNGYDYGVVLRLPSPTDKRLVSRTVVVFGSQTFGVDAASSWLVDVRSRTTSRRVRGLLNAHPNVAVLVRVEVTAGGVGKPELVDLVPLPDRMPPRHG